MHDLLGQQPAVTAALAQPRPEPDDAKGVALAGNGADQRRAVDGIGDRAVDHILDPHLGQHRHPREGAFQHIRDPVQIVGAQRVDEMRVDPVHAPGLAALFVKADQQPVLFLAAVVIADRAAQQGHPVVRLRDGGDVLGHEILVFHRGDGMVHTHHRAHLVHAVAARVHHDIAIHVAAVGVHRPGVIRVLGQPGDGGVAVDLGVGAARAARQRLAQRSGVDIAVVAIPKPAQQVVGGNQRMPAGAFGGVDDLELHAHAARHRGEVAVSVHLRGGVGQTDAAVAVAIADGIVGIVAQFAIKRDRMTFQPDHRLVHAEIRHLRRRMPGRARGQLVALQQHHVGPAFPGQVVERGAACDAAADDDDLGAGFHGNLRLGMILRNWRRKAAVRQQAAAWFRFFRNRVSINCATPLHGQRGVSA